MLIPVDQIDPNPRNPRRVFNEDALNELADDLGGRTRSKRRRCLSAGARREHPAGGPVSCRESCGSRPAGGARPGRRATTNGAQSTYVTGVAVGPALLRKDPVIHPALETRRALLDQTLRKRAGIADIQAWVRAARRQERSSGAEARGGVLDVLQGILGQLNAMDVPTLQRERTALRAIRDRAEQLLAQAASRPVPPVERPAGRASIRTRPPRRRR